MNPELSQPLEIFRMSRDTGKAWRKLRQMLRSLLSQIATVRAGRLSAMAHLTKPVWSIPSRDRFRRQLDWRSNVSDFRFHTFSLCSVNGESDPKRRALVDGALDSDGSTMFLDDTFHNCEA